VIEVRRLTKHYGTIHAVDDVSLEVRRQEILAIVGDNGAGKSTLVKMLAGAVVPDAGSIHIEGAERKFRSPNDARAAGIEMLYQDLALLPNLDVTTNLYLGRETTFGPRWLFGLLSRSRMRKQAKEHLRSLQIDIPNLWRTPVASLSGGQRQSVAIARALAWASSLVIMDEPTAALGVAQSRAVLELTQRVREHGTSVILISHILPHVLELADRIIVMRHGRKVADLPSSKLTQDQLIELIIGYNRAAFAS